MRDAGVAHVGAEVAQRRGVGLDVGAHPGDALLVQVVAVGEVAEGRVAGDQLAGAALRQAGAELGVEARRGRRRGPRRWRGSRRRWPGRAGRSPRPAAVATSASRVGSSQKCGSRAASPPCLVVTGGQRQARGAA